MGYTLFENQIADVAIGAILFVVSCLYFTKNKALKPIEEVQGQLLTVDMVLGIVLIAEGIVGAVAFGYPVAAIVNEVIVGILAFFFAVFATQLAGSKKIVLSGEDGNELVTLTKIDYKDDALSVKAKAFGTMPMLMRVEPEEFWLLVGYLSYDVISHVPGILLKGRAAVKEKEAEAARKQAERAKEAASQAK